MLKNSNWALYFHKTDSFSTTENEKVSFFHNENLLTRIATQYMGQSNANLKINLQKRNGFWIIIDTTFVQ